jgi:ParE toxin of type II toxin-antitoxin system, parDE
MNIRYLETAKPGLVWMKRYFHTQPQLDQASAFENFERAKQLLKQHPQAGEQFEDFSDVREIHITRSAFSILYTCIDGTIFIIDIRDSRGLRSAVALRKFTQELREKYGFESLTK